MYFLGSDLNYIEANVCQEDYINYSISILDDECDLDELTAFLDDDSNEATSTTAKNNASKSAAAENDMDEVDEVDEAALAALLDDDDSNEAMLSASAVKETGQSNGKPEKQRRVVVPISDI